VFLEAWRKRKDVRLSGDSILPWLIAVSNNVLRNEARTLHRYRRLLSRLPRIDRSDDVGGEVDQRLDDERAMEVVLSQMKDLRIEEQEVIAMCDWVGLSYREAADVLDIPVGTISSRIARAHEHLRERMSDDLQGGLVVQLPTTGPSETT
jgi:RNA polymerase sigma-70 factor (ECF subfamily)